MAKKNHKPECCGRLMGKSGKAESGRARYVCSQCGFRTTNPRFKGQPDIGYAQLSSSQYADKVRAAIKAGCTRFIVTAAQNNTRVDVKTMETLEQIAKHRNAMILVIPIHYKNISLYTANKEYRKWWTQRVRPYIVDQNIYLGGGVDVRADIKIQATAVNPLAGKEPISGKRWAIFGHSQRSMRPVAAPATEIPKRLYTTGVVTQKNYSRTDRGARAEFHHAQGALMVEVEGRRAFVRQLSASKGGKIYDLDYLYTPKGWKKHSGVMAITPGDEHVKFMLPAVNRATFANADSMCAVLKPKWLVRHDVLDGYAGSHHHEKSYATRYAKFVGQHEDYRAEVHQVIDHLNETTPKGAKSAIVSSNHHDHLSRWAERADDREDHVNADFIAELRSLLRESIRNGGSRDLFRLYVEPHLTIEHEWVTGDKPFMLGDVDHSQHGHVGPNGARGSIGAFARTVYKLTKGHTHAPQIEKGVYQTGKSTGQLEYEQGYSSHSVTHCVQYPDGKRTLVDIINGKWRGTAESALGVAA